jgi:hypothetical protein
MTASRGSVRESGEVLPRSALKGPGLRFSVSQYACAENTTQWSIRAMPHFCSHFERNCCRPISPLVFPFVDQEMNVVLVCVYKRLQILDHLGARVAPVLECTLLHLCRVFKNAMKSGVSRSRGRIHLLATYPGSCFQACLNQVLTMALHLR